MSTHTHFLVKPVPTKKVSLVDRRRIPRTGPMVDHPNTIEIRSIKKKVSMTTKEFAEALSDEKKGDGIRTTPETLQAYMQGYISSSEMIDTMLGRCRAFLARQNPQAKRMAGMSMVQIMDEWFIRAKIAQDGAESKWRLLGKVLDKDHSTLFRWYQQNRKPRSIDTLLQLEEILEKAIHRK